MEKNLRRIVVVCGYGCNLNSPLQPYLERVARFCELETPECIILCGGETQRRNFPGCTEAETMIKFLKREIDSRTSIADFFGDIKWVPIWRTLINSYTTYENIRDAAIYIKELNLPVSTQITIFCEATRALKVAILARHFMGFPPEHGGPEIHIETDSWERMHPFKELVGTIKDAMATYFPFLNMIQRHQRIARAKTH